MSESSWLGVFDLAIAEAQQASGVSNGDSIGDDGLLYCGKCRTRKQHRVQFELNGEQITRTPPVPCRCMEKAIAEEQKRKEQSERMEAIQKLRKASLMGEQFRESTFQNYKVDQHNMKHHKLAMRYVQKWEQMKQSNQGMLFCGDTGTGKTYLAACIANALLDQNIPVVMTSFVKLTSITDEDRQLTIRRLNQADLLIIDDLGAERGSDFALEQVYDYIDSRCQAHKPMIITTNLTHAQILNTVDIRYKRIYERIIKYCWPMEFTGPSWRRSAAADRFDAMRALLEDE